MPEEKAVTLIPFSLAFLCPLEQPEQSPPRGEEVEALPWGAKGEKGGKKLSQEWAPGAGGLAQVAECLPKLKP
jgi:hypothetical protein